MSTFHAFLFFSALFVDTTIGQSGEKKQPDPLEIHRLIQQLGSEDGKKQEEAAFTLKKLGPAALKPLAKAASDDKDDSVKARAIMLKKMLEPHDGQVWCNYTGPWHGSFFDIGYGIDDVAFSPDNRQVASCGGFHGNVKTWDVITGTFVRRYEADYEWVGRVAFSPDGRYLIGIDLFEKNVKPGAVARSVIYVWEAKSGKLVHRLVASPFGWSVGFSADNKQLICAGDQVQWWDLKTGKEVKSFQLKGFSRFHGLSRDGQYVMGAKENREMLYAASVIDLTTAKELAHFPFGAEGYVTPEQVAYTPDKNGILLNGKKLRLCDTTTGKDLVTFKPQHSANNVAVSDDGLRGLSAHGTAGRFVIIGDCAVRLWDLKTGKELRRYSGHQNPVSSVAFSPDGRNAASGSSYGTLRLWKLPN